MVKGQGWGWADDGAHAPSPLSLASMAHHSRGCMTLDGGWQIGNAALVRVLAEADSSALDQRDSLGVLLRLQLLDVQPAV